MKINVIRQACCAADDQINRLDAVYEVDGNTTIEVLIRKICSSNFLQYSSTHNRLSAEVDGRQVAEIYASGDPTWTLGVLPTEPVASAIGDNTLHFVFRLNSTRAEG